MKVKYLIILLCLFTCTVFAQSKNQIGLIDLNYTLKTDVNTPQGLKTAWDDVHTIATLQGIVNRTSPHLYIFLVQNGKADIDRY